MLIKPEQLQRHLDQGPAQWMGLYLVSGDEALLVQEACDAIRSAGKKAGYSERQVHTVSGAHFDWSGLLGATQSMSLFGDRQFVDIRIPSGKPGKEGAEALQHLDSPPQGDVLTLITLPRLDSSQLKSAWYTALEKRGAVIRIDTVERARLPLWIAQRLAAQGQKVAAGVEGEQTLSWMADRVEGNLLAAHQEIQKLGLLYPAGSLSAAQVEDAVLHVARYSPSHLCEALWSGQGSRAMRICEGLEAEGESGVAVLWWIAEDLRAMSKIRSAQQQGQPLPVALQAARIWGPRERWIEAGLSRLSGPSLLALLKDAHLCDGITKGLPAPDWPSGEWDAIRHLCWRILSAGRSKVTTA